MVNFTKNSTHHWLSAALAVWVGVVSASASENPGANPLVDPSQPKVFRLDATEGAGTTGTAEVASEATAAELWQVNFIRISPHWQAAIINGRLVNPGDEVDGLKVEKILFTEVVGTSGKKTVHLSMGTTKTRQSVHITASAGSATPGRSLPTDSK